MLLFNNKLAVCPITTHIDIKEVDNKLSKTKIVKKVETINNWYKKNLKNQLKFLF